jgi:hypothetical protein
MAAGSLVSIAAGLPLVPAVASLIPGFLVLRARPRTSHRLSGRESLLAIVPTTAIFYGLILIFDLGSEWAPSYITAMLAAIVCVERIGRRRGGTSRNS